MLELHEDVLGHSPQAFGRETDRDSAGSTRNPAVRGTNMSSRSDTTINEGPEREDCSEYE